MSFKLTVHPEEKQILIDLQKHYPEGTSLTSILNHLIRKSHKEELNNEQHKR